MKDLMIKMLLLLFLFGCSNKRNESSYYYPLQEGNYWEFIDIRNFPYGTEEGIYSDTSFVKILIDSVQDKNKIKTHYLTLVTWINSKLHNNDTSAAIMWEESKNMYLLVNSENSKPILELSYPMIIGNKWERCQNRISVDSCFIIGYGPINTPAGLFNNCIITKIVENIQSKRFNKPFYSTRYYAPGIGLVCIVNSEGEKTLMLKKYNISKRKTLFF